MTKKEFSALAMAIRTYYPKENILPNQESLQLWFQALQDIPLSIAEVVLQRWVSTNRWSPTIADFRELSSSLQYGDPPTWVDGWSEVQRAIRVYGMYDVAGAMASFSPITKQVVSLLGFKFLCVSENPSADRANFRMCYETLIKRTLLQQQIPPALQEKTRQLLLQTYPVADIHSES